MHDVRADGDNPSGMSQKDKAAMIEEQRKKYKESWSKKGGTAQGAAQVTLTRLSACQFHSTSQCMERPTSSIL